MAIMADVDIDNLEVSYDLDDTCVCKKCVTKDKMQPLVGSHTKWCNACAQWRAEAVGCPGPTWFLDAFGNILYSSRKISDDLFSVVHLHFHFFTHQLSNFTRIRSLDVP